MSNVEPRSERVAFRVPASMKAALEERAAGADVTLSKWLERLVRRELEKPKDERPN